MQPFMYFTYPNYDEMFLDDNAPSHRVCIVRDWFDEHSEQLQHVIWHT